MNEIGKNLKNLRELNKLTISKLSKLTGISKKSLIDWESGRVDPRLKSILKLVDFYKVRPSVIFGF